MKLIYKIQILVIFSLVQTRPIIEKRSQDDYDFTNELLEAQKFNFIVEPIYQRIRERVTRSDKHRSKASQVKHTPISKKEIERIENRKSKVLEASKKIFPQEKEFKKTPEIAICLSGGGYRAMIATLGFLSGLEENSILDLASYVCALSGSSWALASWMSSHKNLNDYCVQLKQNIKKNIKRRQERLKKGYSLYSNEEVRAITKDMITKYIFEQPIGLIDIFGALVTNQILNSPNDMDDIKISKQVENIEENNLFLPIYTAIAPVNHYNKITYEWFEFNPYVARNVNSGAYTRIWAFGRNYKNGLSIPYPGADTNDLYPPELSLSNYIGIFGSAFAVAPKELLEIAIESQENPILIHVLSKIANNQYMGEFRLAAAEVFNPTYLLTPYKNNIENNYIEMVDSGIDFNLPIPPVLQPGKKPDIIILFDMSGNYDKSAPALKGAEIYACQNNIPFPKIDYAKIDDITISVFEEKGCPTIVYIPFINVCLQEFCSTFNFFYHENEINYVFDTGKNIAESAVEKIKEVVLRTIVT